MGETQYSPKAPGRRFQPYPEYKDSGVDWLSKVPAHWDTYSLRRRLFRETGSIKIGPFGSQLKLEYMTHEGFKVYGQEHVIAGDFGRGNKYIDTDKFEELAACEIRPNDLVVTMMGSSGRCAVVPEGIERGIMDSHLLRIRLSECSLDPKYLCLLINDSSYVREQIETEGKGAIMHGLNSSIIKSILLAVPPPKEQQRILAFLDRETAKIDSLIAKKERLIELLQEKRTALITQAVTKGLDPNVPMKDSGVEWLGKVPAHWRTERNRRLFRESDVRSRFGQEELLTVSHLTGVTKHSEKNVTMIEAESHEGYKICTSGELVINTMWAWMGALGMASQEGMVSPSYNVYALACADLSPRYYDFLCRIPIHVAELTKFSKGVWRSRLRLYPDEFYDIYTPLPPIAEQKRIIDYIDQGTHRANILAKNIQVAIERLKEYRTALISAAVTGKIDVRNGF